MLSTFQLENKSSLLVRTIVSSEVCLVIDPKFKNGISIRERHLRLVSAHSEGASNPCLELKCCPAVYIVMKTGQFAEILLPVNALLGWFDFPEPVDDQVTVPFSARELLNSSMCFYAG